jgi:hypothetical protein
MGSVKMGINTTELLGKLTLEEKVSLLAARDWWRTSVIEREGVFVPHIKVRLRTTFGKTHADLWPYN